MQSLATYLLQKESQTVFPLDNKGRPEVFPMSKLTLTKDVIDAFLGRTNFRVLQIRFIKRHAPDFFVAEHTHWTPLVLLAGHCGQLEDIHNWLLEPSQLVSYKSKKGKVLKLSRDCYYRIVSSQDYHPEFDALDRLISYVLDRKYYAILNDTERLDELAVTGLVVGEAIAMVVTRKKVKSGNSKTGEATKKIQREKEERRATIYQDLKSIPNWQNKSKNRLAKQISKKHSGKRGFSVSAVTRLLPEC